MVKRDCAPAKMSPRMPGVLPERAEHVDVVVEQLGAAQLRERGPVALLGELDAPLVGHLEEEQVGDLLDVVAVVDAVVAQGVAEAPELLDDVDSCGDCLVQFREQGGELLFPEGPARRAPAASTP